MVFLLTVYLTQILNNISNLLPAQTLWPNGKGVGLRSQRLWVRVPSRSKKTTKFFASNKCQRLNTIILSEGFCSLGKRSCYRPQTKFAKVMFLQVSVCPQGGGACVVAPGGGGGHAWLLLGGCACLLGGRAWLLPGGACVVAPGGCVVAHGGACMVARGGGRAWFFRWDTVNERAVRILLECILVIIFLQSKIKRFA